MRDRRNRPNWVYIMTNRHRTVFYIGSTSDIDARMREHLAGESKFTARYNIDRLVYVEEAPGKEDALAREHKLKRWRRDWKIELIETMNPYWRNLVSEYLS